MTKRVTPPNPRPDDEPVVSFWDLPADERAARMNAASERADGVNFFDLDPEERARAYDTTGY